MEAAKNRYYLTLKLLSKAVVNDGSAKQLQLEFENHDEIFQNIEKLKSKGIFGTEEQATEFAIGLKMFGEVMIKNRENPLFADLKPAFQGFVRRLKAL